MKPLHEHLREHLKTEVAKHKRLAKDHKKLAEVHTELARCAKSRGDFAFAKAEEDAARHHQRIGETYDEAATQLADLNVAVESDGGQPIGSAYEEKVAKGGASDFFSTFVYGKRPEEMLALPPNVTDMFK